MTIREILNGLDRDAMKKKPAKIAANLLRKYTPKGRVKVKHAIEGESSPVRVYLQNGKPVNETLPAREKRFSRTFYRKAKPVKIHRAGASLPVEAAE